MFAVNVDFDTKDDDLEMVRTEKNGMLHFRFKIELPMHQITISDQNETYHATIVSFSTYFEKTDIDYEEMINNIVEYMSSKMKTSDNEITIKNVREKCYLDVIENLNIWFAFIGDIFFNRVLLRDDIHNNSEECYCNIAWIFPWTIEEVNTFINKVYHKLPKYTIKNSTKQIAWQTNENIALWCPVEPKYTSNMSTTGELLKIIIKQWLYIVLYDTVIYVDIIIEHIAEQYKLYYYELNKLQKLSQLNRTQRRKLRRKGEMDHIVKLTIEQKNTIDEMNWIIAIKGQYGNVLFPVTINNLQKFADEQYWSTLKTFRKPHTMNKHNYDWDEQGGSILYMSAKCDFTF